MNVLIRATNLLALTAVLGLAASAHAGEIYNNFGPGNTYGSFGRILQGPDVNNIGDVDQAARFNTGAHNHENISIFTAIGVTGPLPFDGRGPLAMQIWSDGGATGPASMLATKTLNLNTYGDQIISANFDTLTLTANTNYWVVLDGLTTFDGAWWGNVIGDQGVTAGRSGTGAWDSIRNPDPNGMLSLRVISRVETVPEPASMAALGLGALAMVRRRAKK